MIPAFINIDGSFLDLCECDYTQQLEPSTQSQVQVFSSTALVVTARLRLRRFTYRNLLMSSAPHRLNALQSS